MCFCLAKWALFFLISTTFRLLLNQSQKIMISTGLGIYNLVKRSAFAKIWRIQYHITTVWKPLSAHLEITSHGAETLLQQNVTSRGFQSYLAIMFSARTSQFPIQLKYSFFGVHKSFLRGHWYPCFGLLVMFALVFKAKVDSLTCVLCYLHIMDSSDSPQVWHLLTS